MLPKKLNKAIGKNHWYNSDAFPQDNSIHINSFMHYNYDIGMHTHDFWELNIVMEGTGGHYIGLNAFEIKSGDVFVIPPRVEHGYHNTDGLHVYHMLIYERFFTQYMSGLAKYAGYTSLFETEPFLRGICPKSLFLHLLPQQLKDLKKDIKLIDTYNADESPFREELKNLAALKMLSQLCYIASNHNAGSVDDENKGSFSILDCLNYIHIHYDKRLTIQELAELCSMSRSTFIRAFKTICGMSPHQYIVYFRTNLARKLLSENYTATDAANECGFYDASHLRKCLHQYEKA